MKTAQEARGSGTASMLLQGKDALGDIFYDRHQPDQTLLYQFVEAHYPALVDQLAQQGKSLPYHVHREFEGYLKCGRLEHGFLRVRCDKCHFERLVAFSCKKRGFCPSCGARRMAETAALLADEVLPDVPLRQWVISFPFPLRYLFAAQPQAMGKVLGIVYRAMSTRLVHKAGLQLRDAATGAVTLIRRLGSALNLNPKVARSTSTSCSWITYTSLTTTVHPAFDGLRYRIVQNWKPSSNTSANALAASNIKPLDISWGATKEMLTVETVREARLAAQGDSSLGHVISRAHSPQPQYRGPKTALRLPLHASCRRSACRSD